MRNLLNSHVCFIDYLFILTIITEHLTFSETTLDTFLSELYHDSFGRDINTKTTQSTISKLFLFRIDTIIDTLIIYGNNLHTKYIV